jgi:hypothetical protein
MKPPSRIALHRPSSLVGLPAGRCDRQVDRLSRREVQRRLAINHRKSIGQNLHRLSCVRFLLQDRGLTKSHVTACPAQKGVQILRLE